VEEYPLEVAMPSDLGRYVVAASTNIVIVADKTYRQGGEAANTTWRGGESLCLTITSQLNPNKNPIH
jgi:hypothetical protein